MAIPPLAGRPAPKDLLVDLEELRKHCHARKPDAGDRAQRVSFGTSAPAVADVMTPPMLPGPGEEPLTVACVIPPATPGPGFDFGRYEVHEEIGRGGMGVVYRARDRELDRTVALKVIAGSHLATAEQLRRFHHEARAAAKVRHPNVVGVFETGSCQGQHYIAMELVDGQDLAHLTAAAPMAPPRAARLVATVATAVQCLHEHGIVHRDLKPSNILVDRQGQPHVADFGVAKLIEAGATVSQGHVVVGTPGFMAPEQVSPRIGSIGPWSDVYSLGGVLYQVLTGLPPFSGESPFDLLVQALEREPRAPRAVLRDVPEPLERICLKCLERSPRDRYQAAAAVARDLENFLAGDPLVGTAPGVRQRLVRAARRAPELAARTAGFALFLVVMVINALVGLVSLGWLVESASVLAAWACGAWILHRRSATGSRSRLWWTAVDILCLTTLLLIGDGIASAMVLLYALPIAAAGLWLRPAVVWITTAMALASYGVLILEAACRRPHLAVGADRQLVVVSALVLLGYVVDLQVGRTRLIGRYLQRR